MGWTSLHREKGISHKDFFETEYGGRIEILDGATKNGVFYAACRKQGSDEVWALVAEFQWTRDHFNFTYKDNDETVGPYQTDCPARILDLLTPTDSEWANEWRAKCRAQIAADAAKPSVKPGDTVRFTEPIEFTNGDRADTFTFETRSTFRAGGRRYNLGRDWKRRDYAVA